jgi:hypothetical protein
MFYPAATAAPSAEAPASGDVIATTDEPDSCGICWEPYVERVDSRCGHSFCARCIVAVLRTKQPEHVAPCPFCRAPIGRRELVYHDTREPLPVAPPCAIIATVGGPGFGDHAIPRADDGRGARAWMIRPDDREGFTTMVWHVSEVCSFECAAAAAVRQPGAYDVFFRVKRLPNLSFGCDVMLLLDGAEVRRVDLLRALATGREWQLLRVGAVRLDAGREVRGEIVATDQRWWKRGLLIDCMVVLPAGTELGGLLGHEHVEPEEPAPRRIRCGCA